MVFNITTELVERFQYLGRFLRTFDASYLLVERTAEDQNLSSNAAVLRIGMTAATIEWSASFMEWEFTLYPLNLHISCTTINFLLNKYCVLHS